MPASLPANEQLRLAKLRAYNILDTAAEAEFDSIVKIAARVLNVPRVVISFIDEERQWNKASVGNVEATLYRGLSFCAHSLLQTTPLVVSNTTDDDRFAQHPHVTSAPGIRFYAGFPIVSPEGYVVGTLGVFDSKARTLTPEEIEFADQLAHHLAKSLENRLQHSHVNEKIDNFESKRSQLEERDQRLQKIYEHSPCTYYVYNLADKQVTFVSKKDKLPLPAQLSAFPQDEYMEIYKRFDKFTSQENVQFVYAYKNDKSKMQYFEVKECILSRDEEGKITEILGIATNISAQKDMQLRVEDLTAKIKKNSLMFTSVLNTISEGIIVVDETGTYQYFNSTAEKLLGLGMSTANSTLWSNTYGYFLPDKTTPIAPEERPLSKAIKGEVVDKMEVFVRNSALPKGAMLVMSSRPLVDESGKNKGGVVTFNNITQMKNVEEKLATLSQVDELTKLPNIRMLISQLEQRLQNPDAQNFVVAVVDIDGFQKLNNQQGNQGGDRIIQSLGRILKWRMRKQDYMGRLKADEFYVIFTDVDELAALRLAEGLRKAVAENKDSTPITVSIGLKLHSENSSGSPESLLSDAEEALQKAKATGKSSVYLIK